MAIHGKQSMPRNRMVTMLKVFLVCRGSYWFNQSGSDDYFRHPPFKMSKNKNSFSKNFELLDRAPVQQSGSSYRPSKYFSGGIRLWAERKFDKGCSNS